MIPAEQRASPRCSASHLPALYAGNLTPISPCRSVESLRFDFRRFMSAYAQVGGQPNTAAMLIDPRGMRTHWDALAGFPRQGMFCRRRFSNLCAARRYRLDISLERTGQAQRTGLQTFDLVKNARF
jgi:hypothetical protein